MSNFLFLEDPLKERLRACLDAADMQNVRIFSLPSMPEGTLPTPSIIIMFDDYRITEGSVSGKHVRIVQTWLVIVTVRSANDIKSGSASRSLAGEIADTAVSSLMGWHPENCTKPLFLTNSPKASYEDGFFCLPIAFEAELIRKSI